MQQNFAALPDDVKPTVYYYWLSDNISQQGVQRDIESMAKVGIGRAFIGNIGLGKEETPYGNVKLFSDEWWKITTLALKTATKAGIDIGMFNSPGWSQSGGPWIKPTETMRYLYSEEWMAEGGRRVQQKLTVTKKDFQPVAVLAFLQPAGDSNVISLHNPVLSSNAAITNIALAADNDTGTAIVFPEGIKDTSIVNIDITLADNFTARSLLLYVARQPVKATVALQSNTNGNWHTIKEFEVDRSNPAENVGFTPYAPIAISFNEITAKQYRLQFSRIQGRGGIAEIKLSAAPVVERFEEKQLAKMFETPLPLWNEYQWPAQEEITSKNFSIDPAKVIDVTKYVAANGTLDWQAPAGNWIIVRYGMVPTGVTNAPATPEGRGMEVDKMNRDALVNHFNSFIGKVQERVSPADRKSFKYVVADSYETGSQNWTDGMADEFKKQYGYDPLPWLPVLTGRIVSSANESNRFLWDLRRLVADKVAYDYVGGLRDISHRHGLKLWLENYGHWGFPSEFLKYGGQSDEVAGEFWNEGTLGNIECRAGSSAAHIYGKTKVFAESFTAGGLAYMRYPALLKKRGDWSFTEGINSTLLHVFIEQPYENRNPGMNAGFGTEFNRKNTWFFKGKAFIDYIRRCNYMLQQGKPVDDVAYFIGEDAPKMTGIRNPALPKGYQFDYINAEVIETRLRVKDGRLVLPDGMSYRLLVLPPQATMRPELLKKIQQLVHDGAVIVGSAPAQSPSLQNFPAADSDVKKMAGQLWPKADGINMVSNAYGKGFVYSGLTMEQVFEKLKIKPDFSTDQDVSVLYTHRTTDSTEIYFITNQSDSSIEFNASFREANKKPAYWDAVTGAVRSLPVFKQSGNTTTIPLKLVAYQSAFIVFKKSEPATKKASVQNNFPVFRNILQLNKSWKVSFDTTMRGPANIVFDSLTDWTSSSNDKIKNYSGTAVYHTSFNVTKLPTAEQLFLDLGNVKVIAAVKLNGKTVGTVWTAPWRVNVTGVVKPGENKLEIEVVNTWVNRLIGDSKLPEAERKTWTNVNTFTPASQYQSSGLMGPVLLQSIKY
ncbi:MAG: glycosyl hydrolase [Bacteroidota bacterium]